MKIIDLSLTIDNECMNCGTPWHEKVRIEPLGRIDKVGRNTSRFVLGSHCATHMDAPKHFMDDKYGIDELNLDVCIGDVTCVDFRHIKGGGKVDIAALKGVKISSRMLFAFRWYEKWNTPDYYKSFPCFTKEAIEFLVKNGMKLMALDTPSPDDGSAICKTDDSPNHKYMLARDIIIVEYLTNTAEINFLKKHELVALPLKIRGADGSPARVILKEEE